MLAAAWLLAAIELNGALISKGAQVALDDQHCAIEAKVMAAVISSQALRQHQVNDAWVIDAARCTLDASNAMLRMSLPQEMLAEKKLALSEASGAMGIALLHDPARLAMLPDYSAQPLPQAIPSAAIDVFLGSDLKGFGTVLANGPWSASALHQQPSQGASSMRASSELFLENGGQIRVGDLRAERGPEQAFGEFRGIAIASRAHPLRADARTEAMLPVQSPSRVQFLDHKGMAIYSSEILPPGNYRVQGFAASAVPGFLQARLLDVNGATQTVILPWTADRKMVLQGETEWDLLWGLPRQLALDLTAPPIAAAKLRHGFASDLTAGADLQYAGGAHRASIEATSSAMAQSMATGALGLTCAHQGCQSTWIAELRSTLGRGLQMSAALKQTADIVGTTDSMRSAQLALSGQISSDIHGSLAWAKTGERQLATLMLSTRIAPLASISLQARHHLFPGDASSWSGHIGLTIHFAKEHTTVSGLASFHSAGQHSRSPTLGMQAAYGSGALYGPQLSLAHQHGTQARSDVLARYASVYGDASIRADTVSDKASWSTSSRLWLTREGARLGPAGEDNLVIQKLGLPAVRVSHAGRDSQLSDDSGIAVFRKAPTWTDAIYGIDPRSIPFGVQLSASRIRVPLASNRVYVLDYRELWSQSRSFRLTDYAAIANAQITAVTDRSGQKIFLSQDGYADLQSVDQLPIDIATARKGLLQCQAKQSAASDALLQEVVLECAPHLAL